MPISSDSKSCISLKECFGVSYLLLFLAVGSCSCPGDPVKCSTKHTNCTITNYLGAFPDRSTCRAANVVYPASESELVSIVADATRNKRKMKVVTRYSHSIPKLVCLDGKDGLLISTKKLTKIHAINRAARTITVDSGVTIQELIDEAAKAGLALPNTPYFSALSVGGILATGAHGSSLWNRNKAPYEYVVQLRIVSPGGRKDGFVKVRTLNKSDPDLNAAKVSLGVLGVISQVTFKLEALFKRSITYIAKHDRDLADRVLVFGKRHEFADMTWRPSQREVVYRIDDRISINTSGDGVYDFIPFLPTPAFALEDLRSQEDKQESHIDAKGKCECAKQTIDLFQSLAFGLTNDDTSFTGYPVVGYQNKLQSSSSCVNSPEDALQFVCPWDIRVKGATYYHETTISIAMSKVKSFIQDIQKLISLFPKSLCSTEVYNGILMRYVKASTAYLAPDQDGLELDIVYYRSKDPLAPRLYGDILEEIEQMAAFKYGGNPHWGKNRNVAFKGVIKKYKNGKKFLRVKKRFDPLGLFSSKWTDQMLGLKGGLSIVKKGCALEGLCICSKDSHCAPRKGYFCRPGKIYKKARVCTRNV